MRDKEASEASHAGNVVINTDTDLDYLDVPAFLRRQADWLIIWKLKNSSTNRKN